MSNLKPVEKKIFEGLFDMAGGYVLDFTNAEFAEFFRDAVVKDIYADKYAYNGDSKAKRLRAFWEVEPDAIVGKLLLELLDVWKYIRIRDGEPNVEARYVECKKIASRLLGVKIKEVVNKEEEFLKKKFEGISVNKLKIDSSLLPILQNRIDEMSLCLNSEASLAAIFLAGSVLEGVLLGTAIGAPKEFNKAKSAPKDKNGKVRLFQEWTLSQLIDVAYELELVGLDVKKFSHVMRDFRNYIHPYAQLLSGFKPDKHTAQICVQGLNAAIANLIGERK